MKKTKTNYKLEFQKYFAEFTGVFFLTLAVSLNNFALNPALPTAVVAALVVMTFVYTVGPISGAHLNPAVTLGMLATKKISIKESTFYVLAQVAAAMLAATLYAAATGDSSPDSWVVGLPVFVSELVGAFILVFGVSAVANAKVTQGASGLVVGGSLLVGLTVASVLGAGVLNPAVALGLGSISLSYLVGPLVGGLLGAGAFKFLMK